MHKILNKLRKLRPGNLLAVLFLAYLGFVASSCLPEVIFEFGRCLYWDTGSQEFINTINARSDDFLSLAKEESLLLNKGTYVNLNGLMAKILRQPIMNERILLTNGHLGYIPADAPDYGGVSEAAENIIRFHDAHTATGGNFLFLMVPTQSSKYENHLPDGYQDSINGPADAFLALLQEAGVPCLDLREELQKDGISISDAYYTTDHHWTPQTGLWAYGEILTKLEQMQIIAPVDPLYTDPESYDFVTYEDAFLGSSGRSTGIYYAGLDDATFIYPKFHTDISVSIPSMEVECRGPYEEVAYYQDLNYDFEDPDFFNTNFYAYYGWNDTPITHWRNEHAPEQNKFLLIGESFGNIPFSLLSMNLGICDELDVRYFEEDFSDYYDSYQPDTVILEFNAGAIYADFTTYSYLD